MVGVCRFCENKPIKHGGSVHGQFYRITFLKIQGGIFYNCEGQLSGGSFPFKGQFGPFLNSGILNRRTMLDQDFNGQTDHPFQEGKVKDWSG